MGHTNVITKTTHLGCIPSDQQIKKTLEVVPNFNKINVVDITRKKCALCTEVISK